MKTKLVATTRSVTGFLLVGFVTLIGGAAVAASPTSCECPSQVYSLGDTILMQDAGHLDAVKNYRRRDSWGPGLMAYPVSGRIVDLNEKCEATVENEIYIKTDKKWSKETKSGKFGDVCKTILIQRNGVPLYSHEGSMQASAQGAAASLNISELAATGDLDQALKGEAEKLSGAKEAPKVSLTGPFLPGQMITFLKKPNGQITGKVGYVVGPSAKPNHVQVLYFKRHVSVIGTLGTMGVGAAFDCNRTAKKDVPVDMIAPASAYEPPTVNNGCAP